ncbi:hypothetical protein WS87_16920 [Burkholderia sp. MSMB0856]|nr:hypothetical protein WS87_16920 [Burkholderia sp. MSMB0856]KVH36101.1 hypothetical protein WS87_13120 [Burkholderia sp. MSMB0856]
MCIEYHPYRDDVTSINADASTSRNPRVEPEPGADIDSSADSEDGARTRTSLRRHRSSAAHRSANRTIDSNAARVTAAPG